MEKIVIPDLFRLKTPFIVAEIGKNFIQTKDDQSFEEYLNNAKELIDQAAKAGVDAVKFQTHVLEDEQLKLDVTSPHFQASDRYSWITRNEKITTDAFWKDIQDHALSKNLIFFSTPMSKMAAQKLEKINPPFWKIGSGDVDDYVLLDYLKETNKPVIFSTGMVSHDELDEIVSEYRKRKITGIILYCVSKYPCTDLDFNLSTITKFIKKYPDFVIGFSDHSVDSHDAALGAVKLGAKVLEKHFTLDRNFWGSDHKASLLPSEMKELVTLIRGKKYEDFDESGLLGDENRELEGADNIYRPYFNKSLVAARDIEEGDVIGKDSVFAMRPRKLAGGLAAKDLKKIVGQEIKRSAKKYDVLTEEHFK